MVYTFSQLKMIFFQKAEVSSIMVEPSLDYFIIIAEELNISKASKRLHISQQSLSTYLQKLETYYNVQLLERKPTMKLTEAGEILNQAGRSVKQLMLHVKEDLQHLTRHQTVSIGIYTPNASMLMDFIPLLEFGKKYPQIAYNITEDLNAPLRDMLAEGKLDLIISSYRDASQFPDFNVRKLYTTTEYIIISDLLLQHYFPDEYPDNINRFNEGVSLFQFKHVPVLMPPKSSGFCKRIEDYCNQENFSLNVAGEISNRYLSNSMIFDNIAWGFSDRRFLTYLQTTSQIKFLRGLHSFPLTEPLLSSNVGIMYRKKDSYPQYFEDLIEMIAEKNSCF